MYLVTTADERSWKRDRPILFLGEWCRRYDRKKEWEGLDAIVAPPTGLETDQKWKDTDYLQLVANDLLVELTICLNTTHGTQYSSRYWNILLGHWLQRFVTVVFNRFRTIEQALSQYICNGTTVFSSSDFSLATSSSDAFVWACTDDVWNHVLYARILGFLGFTECEIDCDALLGNRGFSGSNKNVHRKANSLRGIARNAVARLLRSFGSNQDAVIVDTYLSVAQEALLSLSLGQAPQLHRAPEISAFETDLVLRQRLSLNTDGSVGFERFLRISLFEMIPVCYLEGYRHMVAQANSLPWPQSPKFIFTSNRFDVDEVFKAWTADKVEGGIPYYVGQHGNLYGTLRTSFGWPEVVTCDKFLTWGWNHEDPKFVPAFVFTRAATNTEKIMSDGGLLLTELHAPQRLDPEDSYYQFSLYQEDQFRLIDLLPCGILERVTVRMHPAYSRLQWCEELRWMDRHPDVRIETGILPIQDLIRKSRLIVHSYDSTGILETLSLNIPTMCFWGGGLQHLLPSAVPYYELLRRAGILLDTPEDAAKAIATHWDGIDHWWHSCRVQEARRAFCERYARREPNPIRFLRDRLLGVSDRGHIRESRLQ
jgi:putative transferase (TIGR04331 family)